MQDTDGVTCSHCRATSVLWSLIWPRGIRRHTGQRRAPPPSWLRVKKMSYQRLWLSSIGLAAPP